MDWNDFVERLTVELIRLPANAFLIVQGPGGLPYVQAMRYLNGLDAEAVGSEFLPEPLTADQERRLGEMGWYPPDGETRQNWWRQILVPAEAGDMTDEQATECGKLAGRMVVAFRDVYGIGTPAELNYEASRNGPDGGPLELPDLGVPQAGAEPPPPASAAEPAALDWPDFTERLAAELYGLDPEMVIVVHHRDRDSYYVQALHNPEGLHAEAVGGQVLPARLRFEPRLEERLATAGWRRPGLNPNWSYDLTAGARPAEFRRLAELMTVALRDVQGAGTPDELTYESFRGAIFIELPGLGLSPREPGQAQERRPHRPLPDAPHGGSAAAVPTMPTVPAAPASPQAPVDPPSRGTPSGGSGRPPSPTAQYADAMMGAPTDSGTYLTSRRLSRDAPAGPLPAPARPADAQVAGRLSPERLEAALSGARDRADKKGYFALVRAHDLYLPAPETGSTRLATGTFDDGTYILAFTSPEAMERALRGQASRHRRTDVAALVAKWPRPDWGLAINAGLPSAAYIDGGSVLRMGTAPTIDVPAPRVPEPMPEPVPQPISDPLLDPAAVVPTVGVLLQKVVPHQQVEHYLEGGYDRVAGYVHRVLDVEDLTTPAQIVYRLGLDYPGSPFSDLDDHVHVIRWRVLKEALCRTPYGGIDEESMRSVPGGWVIEKPPFTGTGLAPGIGRAVPELKTDSQRLPHGAEMYRLHADGAEVLVGRFDADLSRWVKEIR